MGVSGAGKTLIGRALARRLGWPFLDGDDFHPASNVDKMRGGTPLEPGDRVAWLDAILVALTTVQRTGGHAVLACSALRHDFREALREDLSAVRFVYLKADRELVRGRISARTDHFMPASLVDSQFATLDEPNDALVIDASKTPEAIVEEIERELSVG
ncbi:MAG TPA: gluconokinase [Vicinamibacterales bacterium]|nr:gluconokinase [Vicinamibacterales bacterium]